MGSKKILLVEDDPNFGTVLKDYLSLHDYNVTHAKDGIEGLIMFKNSDYDLCILDVMMPRKDGFSLAQDIRGTNKEVPIIFLTAKTLIWNGPLGAFEVEPFNTATDSTAKHAAKLTKMGRLRTVAGGGDTVAALNKSAAADNFSYLSTAGGAFLEWLEGKTLPGIAALEASALSQTDKWSHT